MGISVPTPPIPTTMRAVVWEGEINQIHVREVPLPSIQDDEDVIVKVSTAAICGTSVKNTAAQLDIHIYHGLIGATQSHWNVGHEAVGVIVEVGKGVEHLKLGQRVLIPDALPSDPLGEEKGAIYGVGGLLGAEDLGGCQAEYVRVPLADKYAIPLPDISTSEDDKDWVLLSDIWPAAWTALTRSNFQPGDTVAVFGCGPVGLLASYSALLRGASKVYAIDHVDSRLKTAASIGCIPIDLKQGDPATQIRILEPYGVRRSLDLCGMECVNAQLVKEEGYIINQAIEITAYGGGISIIGFYCGAKCSPGSPQQSTSLAKVTFDISQFWIKSLTLGGGAIYPQDVVPVLMALVQSGRAKPSFIVDRIVGIDQVQEAYRDFDEHKFGKTLIVF